MPVMRNNELSSLVAMIDRQLERKRSLEARERCLEKQLEKWRVLLVEKMAAQNPPCTCCTCGGRPPTPAGSRFGSPSRPQSSRGHRRSRPQYNEPVCPATLPRCSCSPGSDDAGFGMSTQWTSDMYGGASSRPPPQPSETMCLCSDEREPALAQIANLADDEIRIRSAIQDTETRIMTTCNAICALKQVVLQDDQAGGQVDQGPAAPPAIEAPAPPPAPPPPPVSVAAVEPDDLLAVRKSSIKDATADLGVVRKSLEGAESVVRSNHTSKEDLSALKASLTNVETSILSAHLSLATAPLPDQRLDSIVSYKRPSEVIEFWNEIEATKHRLSVLVKHSKDCKICKDIFKPTFDRIDEELTGLSEELRRLHTNNPP